MKAIEYNNNNCPVGVAEMLSVTCIHNANMLNCSHMPIHTNTYKPGRYDNNHPLPETWSILNENTILDNYNLYLK